MNETKRMLAFVGGIAVIIALVCVVAFWPEKDTTFTCKVKADKNYSKVAELKYENFDCLQKEDSYVVAVSNKITDANKTALNETLNSNDLGAYLVSLDDYSKEDAANFKKALNYTDNAFDKDVLIYVEKGKVKSYKEGILGSKEDIKTFMSDNGLVKFMCSAPQDADNANLAEVNYAGFECLADQKEPYVIFLAQTTCSYCSQFKPIINKFAEANGVVAYYINVDKITQEEAAKMTAKFEYFTNNESWGTPLSLAVKDGQVVADLSGLTEDQEQIKELYTKAGILK